MNTLKAKVLLVFFISISFIVFSKEKIKSKTDESTRWELGQNSDIVWNVARDKKLPHSDHLEMSGRKVSVIVTYEIDPGKKLKVNKLSIWPEMILKYDYRSYLKDNYNIEPQISIEGKELSLPNVDEVRFNGILEFNYTKSELQINRRIFPSPDKPIVIDRWEIKNITSKTKEIDVAGVLKTNNFKGEDNNFTIETRIEKQHVALKKGEICIINLVQSASISDEKTLTPDTDKELQARLNFITKINQNLQLQTPDPVLNREFQFSKIRAAESIFDTKMGLVHSPGGERYYGGVWANDQVEYAGPFFAYLGYDAGNEASLNAYKIFMKSMTPEFNPIPSSYEMMGNMVFTGAGDRGDASMYGWGASLYALTSGNQETAKVLWPAIQWCLEYSQRKLTQDGVVASNSDEMEGRVKTGDTNLSTSCLAYGAFTNAALLAKNLNEPQCIIDKYSGIASNLRTAIENYFGADIEGYHTYRYYAGHETLRHWICLPMVMGINDRKEGTMKALFEKLWTPNGLLVENGLNIFWDRATLYALRGIFKGGETELAIDKLKAYSSQRLLGEHVPYPVEAYPEGNQAHLSAESALYCRIYIEGLFGIQPVSFSKFSCTPRLPKVWNEMSLINICAFNTKFSIVVKSVDHVNVNLLILKDGKEIYSKTEKMGNQFIVELDDFKDIVNSKSPKIVMFGNSITQGGNWSELLNRNDIKNSGFSGFTTSHFVWIINENVIKAKPKICFLEGGINDIGVGIPLSRTIENYKNLIDTLNVHKIIPVVQSTLYRVNDNFSKPKIDSLNTFLINYCKSHNAYYLDINSKLSDNKSLLSKYSTDGTHLTYEAYKIWAKEINILLEKVESEINIKNDK